MFVRRRGSSVEVLAPAKLNLFLEVLAKRPDGYHEIETLMTPVSLFDTLVLADDASGRIELETETIADATAVSCRATASPESSPEPLPQGSANIVVRALELLRLRSGCERGARVRLTKRIPMAAGMAGGSTDAAAALVAANLAWNLGWSTTQLAEVAAEIGSDVPFFFARTAAVCRGRGERIEPLAGLPPLDFVVVKPPTGLSTADVYRACKPGDGSRQAGPLVETWQAGKTIDLGRLFHNRLQPAAETLNGSIRALAQELHTSGCLGHRMSGSGTSYFALCRDARHARRLASQLACRGLGRTFAVRTCTATYGTAA
ncbi:MAG: 4-(cytidine 5'-diphospho)-2-C-methyl-D-erythritol kinase [Planctomycetia bacterium]|nr:4-(cytidine 5'-diphospho)-2-C-methyl-D-erythritol kinase [Planctomycetia bacterium]